MQNFFHNLSKRMIILIFVAFIFGGIAAFWTRFALAKNPLTHYHANFALYVNGIQDQFSNFTFYEEVAACTGDALNDPHNRVHMHGQVNNVVHVHDKAVTWSHFFENLGYTLTNDVLITPEGIFADGDSNKQLEFYLNGQKVSSVASEVISSEDVLLINYGEEDDTILESRYRAITKNAHEFNQKNDPSSCAGENETFSERFKRTLGITE